MGMTGRGTQIIIGMILSLIVGSVLAADNRPAAAAANPRYVIQGDTVYDKKADLTWQRCSVGQRWVAGTGCVGIVKTFTFDDAQRQGGGTWHVPSKDELATLIDHSRKAQKQSPTVDEVAFPDMDLSKLVYWASVESHAWYAWCVIFDDGTISSSGYRSYAGAVRLVRGGQ